MVNRSKNDFLEQKIIGFGIAKLNGDIYYFGEGKPLMINISNRFLKD